MFYRSKTKYLKCVFNGGEKVGEEEITIGGVTIPPLRSSDIGFNHSRESGH